MSGILKTFERMYEAWQVKDLSEKALAHRKYMRDGKLPSVQGSVSYLSDVLKQTGRGGTFDEIYSRLDLMSPGGTRFSGEQRIHLGWALRQLMQMGLLSLENDGRVTSALHSNDSPPA